MTEPPLLTTVIPWCEFPDPYALVSQVVRQGVAAGLQVVVVDDATHWLGDLDVANLIRSEGASYERLSSRLGPGGARNIGLRRVCGRFVAFTDADDKPNFAALNRMAQLGDATGADVVIGAYLHVEPKGRTSLHLPGASLETALNDQPALWRYVFSHDFLLRTGVRFPRASYAEDLVFLLRVAAENPRTITHSEVCYEYRAGLTSTQLTARGLREEEIDSATREIQSIEGQGVSPSFQRIRNAWLARIWVRRLRSAQDAKGVVDAVRKFPRRQGLVRDSTRVALGQLRRRVVPRRDNAP